MLSGEERMVPTELALYGAIGSILVKEVMVTHSRSMALSHVHV
jgi:hypothetical protein